MASKQLLRRLPLLAREGWSQIGGSAALPASDLSAAAALSTAQDVNRPNSQAGPQGRPPIPGLARSAQDVSGTLGQTAWTQRLSHLPGMQKPLSTLGVSAATTAADIARTPAWSGLAATAKQLGPTAVAAATIPSVAGLLKQPAGSAAMRSALRSEESSTSVTSAESSSAAGAAQASHLLQPSEQPQHAASSVPPPPPPHRRSSGSGGRGSSAINSSIQLNKAITACRNTEELLQLVQQRGSQFDYFNISTALARVPKLAATVAPQHHHHHHHGHHHGHHAVGGAGGANGNAGDLHTDAAGRALMDLLAQLMVTHIESFDARGLANSAWAFGKLKYVPSGGLPAVIASAARRRMGEFSPQNLSNLIWSFVYMHHADEALLAASARIVASRVGEFKPQELANIVWAFASLGYKDEHMLNVVSEQAQRIAPLFKEQELSNVLWALGKLGSRRPDVFESLMAETRSKLPAFLPQGISNVAWALAAAGHPDGRFLDQVVAQCGHQLGAFDVQALANLVWAMASMGYYQPAFISAVVGECLGRGLDRLSPQNLSNILWGCATLGHRDPRMLSAWAAQTLEKLSSFEPQGLSNTAWAFARLGYHSPPLFAALAAAAMHRIDGFNAQGLSNLAWSMATAGVPQPRLFEALARAATTIAPTFNAQNCSVTLWSCASLRHHDGPLFEALLGRLAECCAAPGGAAAEACEPQNVANALWAAARMGHALRPELAAPLVAQTVSLLPRMSQQELCNSLWALAALDLMDEGLWAAFCAHLQRLQDISPEGMHQAFHAELMLQAKVARQTGVPLDERLQQQQGPASSSSGLDAPASSSAAAAAQRPLPHLPEPLRTVAASMWAASARDVHVSRFQQEVSGALAVAGVAHALEWMTDDHNFSVDIGMQVNSKPTAVEVNGAHHYTSNPPHKPLGDMAVRRRLLEERGWSVVDVGFADWQAMGQSLMERGANLVGHIAAGLGEWEWGYAGLPSKGSAAIAALQPPLNDPSVAAATAATQRQVREQRAALQRQQQDHQQQQQLLPDALAAAMGLGPLGPLFDTQAAQQLLQQHQQQRQTAAAVAAAAAAVWPSPSATAASTLGLGSLGYSSSFLAPAYDSLSTSMDTDTTSPFVAAGFSAKPSASQLTDLGSSAGGRGSSSGSAYDDVSSPAADGAQVARALAAAEALGAMPGGNLLLAQQMYDVLGLQLPSAAAAAGFAAPGGSKRSQSPAAASAAGGASASELMLLALLGQQQLQLAELQSRLLAGGSGSAASAGSLQGLGMGAGLGLAMPGLGLGGGLHLGGHAGQAGEHGEEVVSDDDLERVVQYALA